MATLAINLDSAQFAPTASRMGPATEQAAEKESHLSSGAGVPSVRGAELSAHRKPEVAPLGLTSEGPRSAGAVVAFPRSTCASACSGLPNDVDPIPVAPSSDLDASPGHAGIQLTASDAADADQGTITAAVIGPSQGHARGGEFSGAGLIVDEQRPDLLASAGDLVADDPGAAEEPASSSRASARADTRQPESVLAEPPKAVIGIAETSAAASPALDGQRAAATPQEVSAGSSSARPARIASAQAVRGHLQRVKERYESADIGERSADKGQLKQVDRSGEGVLVSTNPPEGTTASSLIIQDDELVAIRLGELVSLFEDRLDRPLYVWMRSSAAASKFVTVETLAASGIKVAYDPATKHLVVSVEQ
jgi:hypothetical protein